MNPDFVDLLRAFNAADVRVLVVGAYALALHGRPCATGVLDLWVDPTPENAARVMQALAAFGAPLTDVSADDFALHESFFQIGVPPAASISSQTSPDWRLPRRGRTAFVGRLGK